MLKKAIIAATALTLLASAAVYAQQRPFQPDGARHQARVEDRAAFLDARVAALHAGLRLSPDQEKSWATFEQAYRELAARIPGMSTSVLTDRLRELRAAGLVEHTRGSGYRLTPLGRGLRTHLEGLRDWAQHGGFAADSCP